MVISATRLNPAKENLFRRPCAMVKVSSVGIYLPPKLLTNSDLETLIDTTDEWITERTGINQRHIVEKGVPSSHLATQAAFDALNKAGVPATDVELIIVATITPDMILPATACLVQNNIGAKGAWGFDLSAACSGFLYALQCGVQFVANGVHKKVLVIGVDVMSTIVDYQDRQTCIIFGDGGGAFLLEPATGPDQGGFFDFQHEVDGSGGEFLRIPAGGSLHPASHETIDKRMHYVQQDGKAVFKLATLKMSEVCSTILERNGLTGADIDAFIPHQANRRIIQAAVDRINIPQDRVVININEYGNTTAGTLPLATHTAIERGVLKRGDLVLMAAMGAGFTVGAALFRW